jgi:hypothetical protein
VTVVQVRQQAVDENDAIHLAGYIVTSAIHPMTTQHNLTGKEPVNGRDDGAESRPE